MKKINSIIYIMLLSIILLLTIPYLIKILKIILLPTHITLMRQLSIYQWVGTGILLFAVIRHFLKNNITWLETFSHELTHIVVAFLFFRKVHSFHADENSGVVYTSGKSNLGLVPMSLAPYCFPLFTYILLSVRCLMNSHGLWIYDILIGMTISFHFYCFKNQISRYQTDINQFPLLFSFLYIITSLLVNTCIVLVAFFPNYNVYSSFGRYLNSIWGNLVMSFNYLF